MGFPYEARHIWPSWYCGELSAEDRFYLERASKEPYFGSSWAATRHEGQVLPLRRYGLGPVSTAIPCRCGGCRLRRDMLQRRAGRRHADRAHHAQRHQYIRPQPTDADVFVLQRPADENLLALIPSIQQAGIAVVVEVDDDLSCLPTTHPAHRILHPKLSPRANWRNVAQACRIADLVTVSTPALAERTASTAG